jgi:hypothetical protein
MKRESGMLLLPLVLFMTIGLGAAFLLVPSMNREDVIEHQRLLKEQARAAAEGALALALHRNEDVQNLELGRATARATWSTEDGTRVLTATAEVPSLRDAKVTFTTTWRPK